MTPEQLETETHALMDVLDERDISAEEALWIASLLTSKAIAQLPLGRPARKKVLSSFVESTRRNIRLADQPDNRPLIGEGRYSRRA